MTLSDKTDRRLFAAINIAGALALLLLCTLSWG